MTATTTTRSTFLEHDLPEGVEFVWANPGDLIVDVNVRTDAAMTPEFLASIRDLGVLTPVVATRTPEGLRVQKGQRRTLAAVETARPGMPVYVVPAGSDVDRIIGQLAENYDRAAMTERDTAAAFEQLSLLGLTASQIAKRTRRTKTEIVAGLTVAKSAAAAEAAGQYALDLVSASLFAEFEGDEQATDRLREAAERGGSLAHSAQRIRDDRTRTQAIADVKAALTADGVPITHAPGYYDETAKRAVTALRAKGSKDPLTVEEHATCPKHVAWVTFDDAAETAAAVYGCADYKKAGHLRWTDPAAQTERTPLSDAERAERRQVRENNAAWRSAETVRRNWLPTIARRKTPPKGGAEFIAYAVVHCPYLLSDAAFKGHRLAVRLLGAKTEFGGSAFVAELLAKATTPRAQVIALVVVLAGIEESTDTDTWRRASPTNAAARYLTALEGWGYGLSDVEQYTCGRTPQPDPEPTDQAAQPEVDPPVEVQSEVAEAA